MILIRIIFISLNSSLFFNLNLNFNLILNSALLTKIGRAPFHFWFPEIAEGLNWNNNLIILTWQKIAPIILIIYNSSINYFFFITILSCIIIRRIIGFNQIRLRKILTFSSINHIGWLLSALLFSKIIWLIYFIIYSIITLNIVFIFNKFKIFFINQLNVIFNYNPNLKNFFIINFFSLGGIPPFLGFIPKWLVINNLILNKQFLLTFIIIIFTLITFYFYIRVIFSSLILNFNTPILTQNSFNDFLILIFNFISLSALILFPLLFNFY